jgi:hypothetical protein
VVAPIFSDLFAKGAEARIAQGASNADARHNEEAKKYE